MAKLATHSDGHLPAEPSGVGSSRRNLLLAGGVLAAAAVTAACSSGSTALSTSAPPSGTDNAAASGSPGDSTTVQTGDIPVGGGEILIDQKIVITQPSAGTFKAFTAVCTHQGCTVASVADGVIQCPCHGSRYSVVDGSVIGGPAPAPLAPVQIKVSGTTISMA